MNFKRTILAMIVLLSAFASSGQTLEDYNSVLHSFQYDYNHRQTDSIFNMFSDKVKTMMPLEKTMESFTKLYQQFGELKSYELIRPQDSFVFYRTSFRTADYTLIMALNKENKIETFRFTEYKDTGKSDRTNFTLTTKNGYIHGTLVTPPGIKKISVVLIIPGSGPTDRNGNNPLGVKSNTYRMIADSLQKEGIATLRYDKRGVGESGDALKSEDSLRFDDMVSDAAGLTEMLRNYWRFDKVFLLGHSEGSLIGMKVAEQQKVDGFISVAGVAERADKIIEEQLKVQSKALSKETKVIFDSLLEGYTVTHVDTALAPIFRRSVQGYIRSWLQYTPKDEIKKLITPVLIIQGTTDMQVGVKEAKKLKKACPNATLTIIDGMNHVLKDAPEDRKLNSETYADPKLPLSAGLIPAIVGFVKGVK